MPDDIDRTDRGILHALQTDARNRTTEEIGERVGLAGSTVASRIAKLEDSGVIEGYVPVLDYERAGFDQHIVVVATTTGDATDELVERALEVSNVVSVRQFMTDKENVWMELVARDQAEIEASTEELQALDLDIARTEVVVADVRLPFDSFGERFADVERESRRDETDGDGTQ